MLSNGMMVTTTRYCGGFLNAMDDAKEGAPVFAKVYFSKQNDFQSFIWMIFPICQRPMTMLQVRGSVFWVQLVTGRRGKVTDKKSYFDPVSKLSWRFNQVGGWVVIQKVKPAGPGQVYWVYWVYWV